MMGLLQQILMGFMACNDGLAHSPYGLRENGGDGVLAWTMTVELLKI